ncbi:MAG: hypothetical protein RLZZ65_270 [Bacteroidota bacterium]|jgi:hypothetical protein
MLFAHLSTFLVFIATVLFVLRIKNQNPAERLLSLFSVIYLISTSCFLAYQYYDFNFKQILDLMGVISELFTLTIPVLYLFFTGNLRLRKSFNNNFVTGILLLIVAALTTIHFVISDQSGFLFYASNKNSTINLLFQIIIDAVLFLSFVYLYLTYRKENQELFDGQFKKSFGLLFTIYYIMDISILIVFAYYSHLTNFSQAIFELGNIMNVIVALLLIHISIHIGWLAEWSLVKFNSLQKNSSSVHKISISKQIQIEDLKKLDLVDYKSVKVHFSKEFESLFNEIDALVDYSKTEKLYYFLDKMDFSHKELSDILNVSVRTVETNFYRLRKKIQKQPF